MSLQELFRRRTERTYCQMCLNPAQRHTKLDQLLFLKPLLLHLLCFGADFRRLFLPHSIVFPFRSEKARMSPFLYDLSFVQNNNLIRSNNCGQAMSIGEVRIFYTPKSG